MPVFDPPTLLRLQASIEAGNLVVLCGAGLSIPQPSGLMSAVRVAAACYDKWRAHEVLPIAMRDDIEALATHFYDNGTLKNVFIKTLVPWDDLVGAPNAGHAAVADFLVCRAAHAALSANFDPLIESWAEARKVNLRGALTGQEATQFAAKTNPLLKFHGCLRRMPEDTLWTQRQLVDADVDARVRSCVEWMNVNLPTRDLLVVGFWSDWGYLNDVLANAFTVHNAGSITVVDRSTSADLQAKAPALWAKLRAASPSFLHVQASSDEALEELRREFSKVWAQRFLNLADPFVIAAGGALNPALASADALTCDELYDLRRDAEGVPYSRAAKAKAPPPAAGHAAFARVLLANAGAAKNGAGYLHHGNKIRVVAGGGQALETVRESYNEPPALASSDIVICAGSESVGTPGAIIARGSGFSIVRPARGGPARWLTLPEARGELGI